MLRKVAANLALLASPPRLLRIIPISVSSSESRERPSKRTSAPQAGARFLSPNCDVLRILPVALGSCATLAIVRPVGFGLAQETSERRRAF